VKSNIFKRLTGALIKLLFTFIVIVLFTSISYAKTGNDFSRPYSLIVHNNNQDGFVPRIKTLDVLLKYFSGLEAVTKEIPEISFKDVPQFNSIKKACQIKLFDCSVEKFYPDQAISQKDFLNWFIKLKYFKNAGYLDKKYPFLKEDYSRDWLETRRLNLLSDNEITYRVFQEFLYRNRVSELNLDQPFSEGLTIGYEEINAQNYHNLKGISYTKNNLNQIISNLKNKVKLTAKESDYLKLIQKNLSAFNGLEESLADEPYVLRDNPNLSPEVVKAVRNYNLQEVLYSYSYNYSKNAGYRKHNLTTGVQKMDGKIFMPGGDIDYWKILSDKRLSDFTYGWIIASGGEEWAFGGGICGSSSMVFLSSWKSGLEILERKSHSKYYSNLYPIEFIGLDATVFRPKPNLRIRNNTGSPIVFNVKDDKKNEVITIEIIGNNPYKNIRIEGPIFIKKNYVKWIRHYEDFDGKITSDMLESRYSAIY